MVGVDNWRDGWWGVGGWMNGWTVGGGWMDRRMDGWMDK